MDQSLIFRPFVATMLLRFVLYVVSALALWFMVARAAWAQLA